MDICPQIKDEGGAILGQKSLDLILATLSAPHFFLFPLSSKKWGLCLLEGRGGAYEGQRQKDSWVPGISCCCLCWDSLWTLSPPQPQSQTQPPPPEGIVLLWRERGLSVCLKAAWAHTRERGVKAGSQDQRDREVPAAQTGVEWADPQRERCLGRRVGGRANPRFTSTSARHPLVNRGPRPLPQGRASLLPAPPDPEWAALTPSQSQAGSQPHLKPGGACLPPAALPLSVRSPRRGCEGRGRGGRRESGRREGGAGGSGGGGGRC